MSTNQEYWDACLIKVWRNAGTIWDAINMFESITNTKFTECNLLRVPSMGFPWNIGVRVFVSAHLSKISARMWEQAPDKDVLMLRKLATSKYDTEKNTIRDAELGVEMQRTQRNKKRIRMNTLAYSNRNYDTNWNVTKGSVKKIKRSR